MKHILIFLLVLTYTTGNCQFEELKKSANEGFVNNNGVKIHYLSWGDGPLMIMLHGFPDFWYSWRHLIPEFSKKYKVVAIDLRGYNLSDKPEGVEYYLLKELRGDVIAVIDYFKANNAILIANDWGGAIAWNMTLYAPDKVDKLIACNIPYPANIGKYISKHPEVAQYARNYQKSGIGGITPESLTANIPEKKEQKYYLEAFRNSSIEAMLNYYKASYPSSKDPAISNQPVGKSVVTKKVKCPVLMIYGLQDKALPPGMLNGTWDNIDNNLTIHTIPDGGHFIQQEKPQQVIKIIKAWLSLFDK